jgi:hypothetical protein
MRGRSRAARRGQGFLIDTDQLALVDLLVEQLQWPVFPRHPVEEGQQWRTAEALPTEELDARQTRDTTLVRLTGDAQDLRAELQTDVDASLSMELGEIGSLAGKVVGKGTQVFHCRRGELEQARGTFQLELAAVPPESDSRTAAGEEVEAPGRFALSAEFAVEVSYQEASPRE